MSAKISNLPPALMQDYSRPTVDFVVLKFGILIAKKLINGNSISSNIAFVPVANKVGQKANKVGQKVKKLN